MLPMGMWHTLPASMLLVSIDSDRRQKWSPDTRLSKRIKHAAALAVSEPYVRDMNKLPSDSEHIDALIGAYCWCAMESSPACDSCSGTGSSCRPVLRRPKKSSHELSLDRQGLQRMLPKPLPIQ
jgi:hypothetical protein